MHIILKLSALVLWFKVGVADPHVILELNCCDSVYRMCSELKGYCYNKVSQEFPDMTAKISVLTLCQYCF